MENNKKRKVIKIVIICIAILLLLGGITYAVYKWRSTESIDVTINVADAHVTFYGGSVIVSEKLEPTLTKEEGIVKTVKIVSDTPYTKFSLHLLINTLPSQLQVESFKWEIYKNDELWDSDNFSGYSEEDDILLVDTENISYPEGDTYTLYIWIDGTEENNLNMMNKTFDFDLYADGYSATEEDVRYIGNFKKYITNLYNSASKTPKTQAGSNMTYNYAELYNDEDYSGGLMNDRLGSMDTNIDGGNIRYYGANPKNYIYFNCEDYSDTTTCELWRIIGIVDGKVKLIRNNDIGYYSWDTSLTNVNNGLGINQWGKSTYITGEVYDGSDLMKLLNPGYDNNKAEGTDTLVNNSLYWNRQTGTCFSDRYNATSACNFTSSGITDATKDNNLIADALWHLGGLSSSSIYANTAYLLERGNRVVIPGTTCIGAECDDTVIRTTTWIGKSALAYVSDYAYASDLTKCGKLNTYQPSSEYAECFYSGWMPNSVDDVHTINVRSTYAYQVYNFRITGLKNDNGYYKVSVYPSHYLNSNVIIGDGDGSLDNPYQLLVG